MIFELKVEITPDRVPEWEERLAEREEQRFMVLEDKPSGRAWLTGYFAAEEEARAAWGELGGEGEPTVRELAEADWRDSYKAHFHAWQFGPLHWVPVWQRDEFQLPAGHRVLWLDPGMAFGTGNHETTRLCCERLAALAESPGATVGSQRVLDAGCGSGILALSAALLGFGPIAGFDNDAEAVRVSQENAALNRLDGRVDFYVGDLVTGLAGRTAEVVLANIQADVLMRFVPGLLGAVAPGGWLVLSGILERELTQVREAFAVHAPGWRVESRVMGEWADLAWQRPAAG